MKTKNEKSISLNFLEKLSKIMKCNKGLGSVILLSIILVGLYIKIGVNYMSFVYLEPILTILTFLVALMLGISDLYDRWVNSLKKRITVYFVYYIDSINELKERLNNSKNPDEIKYLEYEIENINKLNLKEQTPYCVLICEEALLHHENDIRNFSQQIGRQFENGGNLGFCPFMTIGYQKDIIKKTINGETLVLNQYSAFLFLNKFPKCLSDGKGRIWLNNYDDTPTNTEEKFKIKEINYKSIVSYEESNTYIQGIERVKEKTEISE